MTSLFLCLAGLLSASLAEAQPISLDGSDWTLDYWQQGKTPVRGPEQMDGVRFQTVAASVPGNVELDLLRAGLIEDPQTDSNVYLLEPWESFQWRYSRVFATPATEEGGCVELRFEGIDCFADIWLNGHHAGSTDNMLVSHAFDVTELLRPEGQENRLEVYLRSSVLEGRKQITPSLSRNSPSPESIYVRRAPHTYGWDIMPRLVSAGLWRSVVLEVHPKAWIRDTYWYVESLRPEHARIYLDYTLALPPDFCTGSLKAAWRISRDGKTAAEGETTARVYDPKRFRRFHVHPLHRLKIRRDALPQQLFLSQLCCRFIRGTQFYFVKLQRFNGKTPCNSIVHRIPLLLNDRYYIIRGTLQGTVIYTDSPIIFLKLIITYISVKRITKQRNF